MFVKIMNMNGCQIIGDLADIRLSYLKSMDDRIMTFTPDDDYINVLPTGIEGMETYELFHIDGKRGNGKTVEIMTNQKAYLCNENGKTIERLN